MIKPILILSLVFSVSATAFAKDDQKAIYVGDGRYTCSGNSTQCAQVESNNRQRENAREYDSRRSQDAAQSFVDGERRKQQERQNVR